MVRTVLLIVGCFLWLFHQFILPLSSQSQFIIFLAGILLLGIPHGAVDLLVATKNAKDGKQGKPFSMLRFFIIYLGRLFMFAAILWFFPVAGNLLFVLFAAYHFGETDLYQFKTNTLPGKLLVISYGLLILSVILLHHFEEVKPLFTLFESGRQNASLINWLDSHRYELLSFTGIFFFTTCFTYFLRYNGAATQDKGYFLIRLAILLLILFNLPMILGFTFYFVVWHSLLSLRNIITYLTLNSKQPKHAIGKQILGYSLLAIGGIAAFAFTSLSFINSNSITGYLFLGLAVLTAPHLQIMHDMYNNIRVNQSLKALPRTLAQ